MTPPKGRAQARRKVTPPAPTEAVYDERGNVRPFGTPGARPMSYDERVALAAALADAEKVRAGLLDSEEARLAPIYESDMLVPEYRADAEARAVELEEARLAALSEDAQDAGTDPR
ncbi:MAG: hypothetical protein ACRCZD_12700 [Phycicoccus sp.]